MKKCIFIPLLVALTCCAPEKCNQEECFIVDLECSYKTATDRNGKDYVLCWVNDSLMFSGFYTTTHDSRYFMDCGPDIAKFDKTGLDSVKIKICLLSTDSVLFAGQKAVDTTFFYRIDNIPRISIVAFRPFKQFDVFDPVTCPGAFEID